jgi:hypothetical protein
MKTIEKRINFIDLCASALNKQFAHLNYRVVFDYVIDEKKENELSSAILTLLNDEDVHLVEHTTTKLDTVDFITDFFITFITEINVSIDSNNSDNQTLYVAFETDVWNSQNKQLFLSVFSSKIKALLEVQLHFSEVIYEDSGFYKPVKSQIGIDSEFDAVDIEKTTLNIID